MLDHPVFSFPRSTASWGRGADLQDFLPHFTESSDQGTAKQAAGMTYPSTQGGLAVMGMSGLHLV